MGSSQSCEVSFRPTGAERCVPFDIELLNGTPRVMTCEFQMMTSMMWARGVDA